MKYTKEIVVTAHTIYFVLLILILFASRISWVDRPIKGPKHFAFIVFRLALLVLVFFIPVMLFGYWGFALVVVVALFWFLEGGVPGNVVLAYDWVVLQPGETLADRRKKDQSIPTDTSSASPKTNQETGMIGKTGHAVSQLRPYGTIKVDGSTMEGKAMMGYIDAGASVRVTSIQNDTLVVEAIPEERPD